MKTKAIVILTLTAAAFFAGLAPAFAEQPTDGVSVGSKLPLQFGEADTVTVIVVIGAEQEWFGRNIILQAGRIGDKYRAKDVQVFVASIRKDFQVKDYFKNGEYPPSIRTGYLDEKQRIKLGVQGTPWMAIIDAKGIVRKIQIGWKGYNDEASRTKPWLLEVASQTLDQLIHD